MQGDYITTNWSSVNTGEQLVSYSSDHNAGLDGASQAGTLQGATLNTVLACDISTRPSRTYDGTTLWTGEAIPQNCTASVDPNNPNRILFNNFTHVDGKAQAAVQLYKYDLIESGKTETFNWDIKYCPCWVFSKEGEWEVVVGFDSNASSASLTLNAKANTIYTDEIVGYDLGDGMYQPPFYSFAMGIGGVAEFYKLTFNYIGPATATTKSSDTKTIVLKELLTNVTPGIESIK